jgi:glycosyltransferase involved in cell wall biosynthesis
VKILAVVQEFPWPAMTGARIRLDNVVRGLCQLGDVDLLAVLQPNSHDGPCDVPIGIPISRVGILKCPPHEWPRMGTANRAAWLVAGKLPTELVRRDYTSMRAAFRTWAHHSYDLAWFMRVETFVAVGAFSGAPVIVDIDDLRDRIHLGWVEASKNGGSNDLRPARRSMNRIRHRRNANLWRRLQRRVASSVEAVVVCSEQDRLRLGVPNAFVVPNGYERPTIPVGRVPVAQPPTVLMPGNFRYSANIDGARNFVSQILPRMTARNPEVRLRLVGDSGSRVRALEERPRVVVTGMVPDMTIELAKADLVVVPLRYGSGTRIKILEAFAHRIPVVTTTVGADGIDVTAGRHLLIADTPEDFTDACLDLLTNYSRRRALVEEAYALFEAKYRWDDIRARIGSLAGGFTSRLSRGELLQRIANEPDAAVDRGPDTP